MASWLFGARARRRWWRLCGVLARRRGERRAVRRRTRTASRAASPAAAHCERGDERVRRRGRRGLQDERRVGSERRPGASAASRTTPAWRSLSADCPRILANGAAAAKNDDAIVLGTIFSLKGVNQVVRHRAHEQRRARGRRDRGEHRRPPRRHGRQAAPARASSRATTRRTTRSPTRAAQHLKDVGVPAIIGPGGSGLVTAVAQNVTIPAGRSS